MKMTVSDAVVYARVGDEAVLLDTQASSYFALNPVAARVWELMSDHVSAAAVAVHLGREFDVSQAVLETDVERFLNELVTLELLRVTDPE